MTTEQQIQERARSVMTQVRINWFASTYEIAADNIEGHVIYTLTAQHTATSSTHREEVERLKDANAFLSIELDRVNKEFAGASSAIERLTKERDEATRHNDQMNIALGKLAPKGAWICEVLENIWRADSVAAATKVAIDARRKLEALGLIGGPRTFDSEIAALKAALNTARAESARLREVLGKVVDAVEVYTLHMDAKTQGALTTALALAATVLKEGK